MAYEVSISPRTTFISDIALKNFIIELEEAYKTLQSNPYLRIVYKNIRVIKLKKFPFALYLTLNEEDKKVSVLSCFHTKRNPHKRPM